MESSRVRRFGEGSIFRFGAETKVDARCSGCDSDSERISVMSLIALIPPGLPGARVPLLGVLAFGGMANVCYLLGPAVEIALEKLWGEKLWGETLLPVGPGLSRMGLTFSVGLALFPPCFS